MTQKERMLSGAIYRVDESLAKEMRHSRGLQKAFNEELDPQKRRSILEKLLGNMGENAYIEPPFRCDYGSNIHVGKNFYANFECIALDQCPICIGDNVFLGPRVSLYCAQHPIDAVVRNSGLESGKAITIGSDVWIGGDTVILGGVTIGNNVVIGAGSVITKDIPSNAVAVGNPCRVLRAITEEDAAYWNAQAEDWEP